MNTVQLSIVIPTYRELENLRVLCPWVARELTRADISSEIVVVDDDSGDGTARWADQMHDWVHDRIRFRFISRKHERGLVSAWQQGVAQAKGNAIAIMDADLCHDPAYLPVMFEALGQNDMVLGSRYLPGKRAKMPDKNPLAAILSRWAQYLCRWTLHLSYRDMSHSFRMFRSDIGSRAFQHILSKGNSAMVEHVHLLHKAGGRIVEVPVTYGKRVHGNTKLRVTKEGFGLLRTLLRLRFSAKPKQLPESSYEQA